MSQALMILLTCVGLLSGCSGVENEPTPRTTCSPLSDYGDVQKAEYRKISSDEAKKMMEGKHILLDVRTDAEFVEKRIEGAILIPDYELKDRAEKELTDKNALILVYCRSGRRSAVAAKELIGLGYTNVHDFGGIIDWPYDTVSGDI